MNSRDPPSKILLIIITQLPRTFPLTNDFLHEEFKHFGEIRKILIFERGKANKAFIEYINVKDAVEARKTMLGKQLALNGGRMQIHFSRLKNLDLAIVDQSRGTNYTSETKDDFEQVQEKSSLQNQGLNYSKTDDPNELRQLNAFQSQQALYQQILQTLYLQQQLQKQRNDEINNLLDDDEENEPSLSSMSTQRTTQQQQENFQFQNEISLLLSQKPTRYLKITNLDERVTAKMILNLFNYFGNVEAVLYHKIHATAFIQFVGIDYALIAKEYLSNLYFFGNQVQTSFYPIVLQLKIRYHPDIMLQPTSLQDDFLVCSIRKHQHVYSVSPPTQILNIITQFPIDHNELIETIQLVGKVQVTNKVLSLTMADVFESLKVISVYSDSEYHGSRIIIQ